MAVYSNLSEKAVRLGETHEGWSAEPQSVVTYTTSGSKNLQEKNVEAGSPVYLDAESVTTVVYNL